MFHENRFSKNMKGFWKNIDGGLVFKFHFLHVTKNNPFYLLSIEFTFKQKN